ncbi:MAG: ATP-binding protein [Verrucomicrobia subdivision 3 bacterium]|nr:ATP-binding protein [Limisphaerales bacterium]
MKFDRTGSTSEMAPPIEGAAVVALPAVTLRAYALAAIASCLNVEEKSEVIELRFLHEHLTVVAPGGEHWVVTLPDYLNRPDSSDQRLVELSEALSLTLTETLAVALAAAVEEDLMVGRALAHLQSPVGGSRPTLGLLATALLETTPPGAGPIETLSTGAGMRSGLLTLLNETAPLPERAVSVPAAICLALGGHDAAWPGATIGLGETAPALLPPSILEEAKRQAAGLTASTQRLLVVRTGSVSEGKSVAAEIARSLGRRAVFIETEKTNSLGPWLLLRGLLPVFRFELGPGERKLIAPISSYGGPVIALCGPDGSVESPNGAALSWSLPVPGREERARLWEQALGVGELADELARHHRHGSGRIAHLGRLAHHHAVLKGREQLVMEDIVAASWSGEGGGLDMLAQPIRDRIADEALVVTERLRGDLEMLLLRCRARDSLAEKLGASATARYHPGVRALFVGPSGTGKTLAAGWLATKMGMPLYRVDLASVTSKYIGETEKNLAQLLARAEQSEVVLLFDEADSMFGKRTEINEANDRFANAQTNYLLQRIESFDGITILTSNSRARFDEAFARRLDLIVEFPAPGPEERRRLWQSHLGENHALTQAELNQLAATADLCGGHIRNVVLAAAVRARTLGRPIDSSDLALGLISEYRKLGRQLPVELRVKV